MFKRGDIFKVSEYFRSTTLQHDGFVGRGELFSAEGFLLGFKLLKMNPNDCMQLVLHFTEACKDSIMMYEQLFSPIELNLFSGIFRPPEQRNYQ